MGRGWGTGRRGGGGSGCPGVWCGGAWQAQRPPGRAAAPPRGPDERGVPGRARRAGWQPASAQGGRGESRVKRRAGGMDRGLEVARASLTHVRASVRDLHAVDRPLRPSDAVTGREREGRCRVRQEAWQASAAPVDQPCAKRLSRCEPGVCGGGRDGRCPGRQGGVGPLGHTSHRSRASAPWPAPRGHADRPARADMAVGA